MEHGKERKNHFMPSFLDYTDSLYYGIVDLQCYISFGCTESESVIHTSTLFKILFPYRPTFFFWLKENTIPYRSHFDAHGSKLKGYVLSQVRRQLKLSPWGNSTPFWRVTREQRPTESGCKSSGKGSQPACFDGEGKSCYQWEGGLDLLYILLEARIRMKGSSIL